MSVQEIEPQAAQPIPAASRDRAAPLGVVQELLRQLDAAGIAYCHWKSNEHLRAAAAGETDLDLLVERAAAPVLAGVLAAAGFRRFAAPPGRGYPGIEDHLALDPGSGRLVHLHLHFQLTVGEAYLKGYHLPWEEAVLSTRRLDEETGIYAADPQLELVLLLVRAALKLRVRDLAAGALGRPYLRGGALRELRWLAERAEPGRLREVATALVGEAAAGMLPGLVASPPSAARLLAFRRSVRPRLSEFRMHGAAGARLRRWGRECRALRDRALRRYLGARLPSKRVLPQGGIVVALIGPDGSGKSTICRELARWLSWKVDVLPIYFGSGNGPVSLLRRPLRLYGALRRWSGSPGRRKGPAAPGGPGKPGGAGRANGKHPAQRTGWRGPVSRAARGALHLLWAWTLWREKRARLELARRERHRGRIVLCDRYPQSQFAGFNDGPLLSGWLEHRSRLLRALARRENAVYRAAGTYTPDLVVKLSVAPEVAWRRKPERSLEALGRRIAAVRELRFPSRTRVVEVDAGQPFDQVLLEVKRALWGAL